MKNGRKFHDVWTLAADGKHYTNDMVITRSGGGQGGGPGGGGGAPRTVKFSFTKQD